MPEGFVQKVIEDADDILGVLPHVITTMRKGVLIANAGVDQSKTKIRQGHTISSLSDEAKGAVVHKALGRTSRVGG